MEKAKKFWIDVHENQLLEEELKQYLDGLNILDDEEKADAIETFANKKGYDVTAENLSLTAAKNRNAELTEEELMQIGGGIDVTDEKFITFCAGNYLCYNTWNSCLASNECEAGTCDCHQAVAQSDCCWGLTYAKGCSGIFADRMSKMTKWF